MDDHWNIKKRGTLHGAVAVVLLLTSPRKLGRACVYVLVPWFRMGDEGADAVHAHGKTRRRLNACMIRGCGLPRLMKVG